MNWQEIKARSLASGRYVEGGFSHQGWLFPDGSWVTDREGDEHAVIANVTGFVPVEECDVTKDWEGYWKVCHALLKLGMVRVWGKNFMAWDRKTVRTIDRRIIENGYREVTVELASERCAWDIDKDTFEENGFSVVKSLRCAEKKGYLWSTTTVEVWGE